MSIRSPFFLLATMGLIGLAGRAQATLNQSPPSGNVIYSLTGQTISRAYQTATINFTPTGTTTSLSFAFREDPAFLELANVVLVDSTTSSGNLLTNGDFSLGLGASAPPGWTYLNTFGAAAGGRVLSGCGLLGGNCYFDGAVGAYDAITQSTSTTLGDIYTLNFQYADTYGFGTYQPLNDSSGPGIDMFVYAGALPTRVVPEPGSLAMLGLGVIMIGLLGFAARRRA